MLEEAHTDALWQDGKTACRQSFWARSSWDIRDPHVGISLTPAWDVPDKTFCKAPFSGVFDREWPGRPTIWVGMSRDQISFMQETLG